MLVFGLAYKTKSLLPTSEFNGLKLFSSGTFFYIIYVIEKNLISRLVTKKRDAFWVVWDYVVSGKWPSLSDKDRWNQSYD